MEVNINPYESPRVGEPMKEQPIRELSSGELDSVRQILIDIRNGQRELLELHRETVAHARDTLLRTQRMRPFSYVMMAIALIMMIAMPLMSFLRIRPPLPTMAPPARVVPRAAPPPPVTKAAGTAVPGF